MCRAPAQALRRLEQGNSNIRSHIVHMHIAGTFCRKPYVGCPVMSNSELMRRVHGGVHVPTAVADKALVHVTSA